MEALSEKGELPFGAVGKVYTAGALMQCQKHAGCMMGMRCDVWIAESSHQAGICRQISSWIFVMTVADRPRTLTKSISISPGRIVLEQGRGLRVINLYGTVLKNMLHDVDMQLIFPRRTLRNRSWLQPSVALPTSRTIESRVFGQRRRGCVQIPDDGI
jgi:hypothetical protein